MSAPLPPLPPVPTEARPGGRSILDILADEHRALADLDRHLADGRDQTELGRMTSELCARVSRHLSAEEQYLYPTVASALPDGAALARTEVDADQAIQHALRTLEAGGPTDLTGIEQLRPALRGHIDRCTRSLFPALLAGLTAEELIRLGNRVEIAEEAAPTRPHPGTPATPPWNKVVEPAVGVLDKVRDVLGNRHTGS